MSMYMYPYPKITEQYILKCGGNKVGWYPHLKK
jgi:hypothetical protein